MVRSLKPPRRFRALVPALAVVVALVLAVSAWGGSGGSPSIRSVSAAQDSGAVADVVFAIHGGAGTLRREDFTPELEARYRNALT